MRKLLLPFGTIALLAAAMLAAGAAGRFPSPSAVANEPDAQAPATHTAAVDLAADLERLPAARRAGEPIRFAVATPASSASPAARRTVDDQGVLSSTDTDYLASLFENELVHLERRLDSEAPTADRDAILDQAERLVEGARLRAMLSELRAGRYATAPFGDGIAVVHADPSPGVTLLVQPARHGEQVVDAVFALRHAEHAELLDAIDYRNSLRQQQLAVAHDAFNRLDYVDRERLVHAAKHAEAREQLDAAEQDLVARCFGRDTRIVDGFLLRSTVW